MRRNGLKYIYRHKFRIVEFAVIIGNLDLEMGLNFSQHLFHILNVRICLVSSWISKICAVLLNYVCWSVSEYFDRHCNFVYQGISLCCTKKQINKSKIQCPQLLYSVFHLQTGPLLRRNKGFCSP